MSTTIRTKIPSKKLCNFSWRPAALFGCALFRTRAAAARAFGQPDFGFHGDRIFQELIRRLTTSAGATAFVETGTYLGDSSLSVHRMNRHLPIFTCEINKWFFNLARRRLAKLAAINMFNASSTDFLVRLIDSRQIGACPLFFLDAHWYDEWPLLQELELITSRQNRGVIIIDDFLVASQPQFKYDVGGGGGKIFSGRTHKDERPCNLELIQTALDRRAGYQIFLPGYTSAMTYPVFPGSQIIFSLRGYAVIELNDTGMFSSPAMKSFISEHYYRLRSAF